MGLGLKISPSTFDYNQTIVSLPPNPNPLRWELIEFRQVGEYLIVKVRYLDCINYEGVKILVFRGIGVEVLVAQGACDPHFSENPNLHSPIARFIPTQEGMEMAQRFVEMMDG